MNCMCEDFRVSTCADCKAVEFLFNEEELEDVHTALSFFVDEYPDQAGSVATRKAMKKLVKKISGMKQEALRLEEGE